MSAYQLVCIDCGKHVELKSYGRSGKCYVCEEGDDCLLCDTDTAVRLRAERLAKTERTAGGVQ
jgi:hypothetical protein